ncbi:MAG: hypothetical protein JWL88_88 [Parcubacteria group bacterium]|nr:hypothetical protein [Parcubacteria group bacterium]
MSVETWQICFLLDSGEWGELSSEVEGLKAQAASVEEAEQTFSSLFEQLERRRVVVFKNHFLTQNTGLCQLHRHYSRWSTDDYFFPLDQLKVVEVSVIRPLPRDFPYKKVLCEECLTRFLDERPYPALQKDVLCVPSPEQFWVIATDDDIRRLARHLKMPSLRDYVEVCEEARERRESS